MRWKVEDKFGPRYDVERGSCEKFTKSGLKYNNLFQFRRNNLFLWHTAASGQGNPVYRGFMITNRHTTLFRAPLWGWSAWRRVPYLPTHNTADKRHLALIPAGFEPGIPAEHGLSACSYTRATLTSQNLWNVQGRMVRF